MSDDDDNEQAISFSFSNAFDAAAWDAVIASEFEEVGVKLVIVNYQSNFAPALKSDTKALYVMLAAALKNVMLAHARIIDDLVKTSDYDKKLLILANAHCNTVVDELSRSTPVGVDKGDHALFNALFNDEKQFKLFKKFAKDTDPAEFATVFGAYPSDAAFKSAVADKYFQKTVFRNKKTGKDNQPLIKEGIANVVNALIRLAKPPTGKKFASASNVVNIYRCAVVAFVYLMHGNGAKAFEWFDSGFAAAQAILID